MSLKFGYEDIYNLNIDSSFACPETQSFELAQETLTNYSTSTHNSTIFSHSVACDVPDLSIKDRYIVALPETLDFVGTYRPGNFIFRTVP